MRGLRNDEEERKGHQVIEKDHDALAESQSDVVADECQIGFH
jgi:hypothetical protein